MATVSAADPQPVVGQSLVWVFGDRYVAVTDLLRYGHGQPQSLLSGHSLHRIEIPRGGLGLQPAAPRLT